MSSFALKVAAATLLVVVSAHEVSAQTAGARRGDLGGGFIEFLYNAGQPAGPIPGARRAEPAPVVVGPAPAAHLRASYQAAPQTEPVRPLIQRPAGAMPMGAAPQGERYAQPRGIDPRFLPQVVPFSGNHRPGTIVINTAERHLYLVQAGGTAMRYGVGIGRPGFGWTGTKTVTRKAEWPDWRPRGRCCAAAPTCRASWPAAPTTRSAPAPLSRVLALSHPRLERALDHRAGRVLRLLPHAQRGCHRPLQPGARRHAGGGHVSFAAGARRTPRHVLRRVSATAPRRGARTSGQEGPPRRRTGRPFCIEGTAAPISAELAAIGGTAPRTRSPIAAAAA